MTKNIVWSALITQNDSLSLTLDNYKIVMGKEYDFRGRLVPRTNGEIIKYAEDETYRKYHNKLKSTAGVVGGIASIGLGYFALASGPAGWSLYGAYLLVAAGGTSVAAGAINYVNEGEWNKMISEVKANIGFAGSEVSKELEKLYQLRIINLLKQTSTMLMTDQINFNESEIKEMEKDRHDLIFNINKMISKQDPEFSDDIPTGHLQFIEGVKNFSKMINDMIYINKNGKTKHFSPSILPDSLADKFSKLNKDDQENIIKGYFASFIATLEVSKDALSKNTTIDSIHITKKENCVIL